MKNTFVVLLVGIIIWWGIIMTFNIAKGVVKNNERKNIDVSSHSLGSIGTIRLDSNDTPFMDRTDATGYFKQDTTAVFVNCDTISLSYREEEGYGIFTMGRRKNGVIVYFYNDTVKAEKLPEDTTKLFEGD